MMLSEMANSALFDDVIPPYSYDDDGGLNFCWDNNSITTIEDLMNVIVTSTPALSQPLPSPAPEYSSSISSSTSTDQPTTATTGNYDDHLKKITDEQIISDDDDDDENQEKQLATDHQKQLSTTRTPTTLKVVPKKKKKQKKEREARFAFMTKSDVDHLDDGFRWRKYGQKAVKHSPFPRSYYRCTSTGCGVKKRVERCYEDASIVVTTYEGKHTHPLIVLPPRPAFVMPPPHHQMHLMNNNNKNNNFFFSTFAGPTFSQPSIQERPFRPSAATRDHGLLQDMLPSKTPMKG